GDLEGARLVGVDESRVVQREAEPAVVDAELAGSLDGVVYVVGQRICAGGEDAVVEAVGQREDAATGQSYRPADVQVGQVGRRVLRDRPVVDNGPEQRGGRAVD